MTLALVLFSIIAYVIGAAFTFGFVAGLICKPYEDPWSGPGIFFASVFWPLTLIALLAKPAANFGKSLGKSLLRKEEKKEEEEKAKIRIAEMTETKARLEMEALEKELAKDIYELKNPDYDFSTIEPPKPAKVKAIPRIGRAKK